MDWAAKGQIGELFDLQAEPFRGGLQEVAVARRALRVQLEILYAAVFQDNELDVLAADVDDDVRIVVKLERGFGVGDRFDQADIGFQNILENVFGVAGGCDAENFEFRALRLRPGREGSRTSRWCPESDCHSRVDRTCRGCCHPRRAERLWWKSSRRRCRRIRPRSGPFGSVAGMNFLRRYCSRKIASSSSLLTRPDPPDLAFSS